MDLVQAENYKEYKQMSKMYDSAQTSELVTTETMKTT